ncbi:MAG TPA: hypothetical protein VGO18_14370, partial [Steroidobacteraceae bacterium]|nr:hypothetical protein [Steroidobacteraceae bacterium]
TTGRAEPISHARKPTIAGGTSRPGDPDAQGRRRVLTCDLKAPRMGIRRSLRHDTVTSDRNNRLGPAAWFIQAREPLRPAAGRAAKAHAPACAAQLSWTATSR